MENISIKLDEKTKQILSLIKMKYGLVDNSQAIELIINSYEDEQELKPEFIEKINLIEKQKTIRVDDFSKRYNQN